MSTFQRGLRDKKSVDLVTFSTRAQNFISKRNSLNNTALAKPTHEEGATTGISLDTTNDASMFGPFESKMVP